jgi:hypothetical protein
VLQENLKVNDRTLILASVGTGSNEYQPLDGLATNDKSGIQIDGFPSGYNSNVASAYEKSFRWNYGATGMNDLGTSNMSAEAFWEVLGGSLRITNRKVSGSNVIDTSFGFRVNELDELELTKKFWDSNLSQYRYKRLARFGRIL